MDGSRLHFARLSGTGPSSGWVSVRLGCKELLSRTEKRPQAARVPAAPHAVTATALGSAASGGWAPAAVGARRSGGRAAAGWLWRPEAVVGRSLATGRALQAAAALAPAAVERPRALQAVVPPVGDVVAALQYLVPDERLPFNYMYPREDGGEQAHGQFDARPVTVYDARREVGTLSLDRHGVILVPHRTAVATQDFYDKPEKIWQDYYEEVRELVQRATGASKVVVFDHNVRNPRDMKFRRGVVGYVPYAHNDYTTESAPLRLRDVADEAEAEELLQRRFVIINVWRNISDAPVVADPLAVCDGRTVHSDQYVPHDLFYKDRKGQTYSVTHGPEHRWLYFSGMRRDEALLLKCYDSFEDPEVVRWTAHCGFVDPRAPADAPVRESVDSRCIAFFAEGDESRTSLLASELPRVQLLAAGLQGQVSAS